MSHNAIGLAGWQGAWRPGQGRGVLHGRVGVHPRPPLSNLAPPPFLLPLPLNVLNTHLKLLLLCIVVVVVNSRVCTHTHTAPGERGTRFDVVLFAWRGDDNYHHYKCTRALGFDCSNDEWRVDFVI